MESFNDLMTTPCGVYDVTKEGKVLLGTTNSSNLTTKVENLDKHISTCPKCQEVIQKKRLERDEREKKKI